MTGNGDASILQSQGQSHTQKQKKGKAQLTSTGASQSSKRPSNQPNFGPVHYHNNSGGINGEIFYMQGGDYVTNMPLNNESNLNHKASEQNSQNDINLTNFNMEQQKMMSQSFITKPNSVIHSKQKVNANISQSSVTSGKSVVNTNHKNSLMDESIS